MQCYRCQADVTRLQRFCPACGQPLPLSKPSREVLAAFDVEAFRELREEKDRLAAELETMLERVGARELTADEKDAWTQLYRQWRRVADAITAQMQRFSVRLEGDRRAGPIRQTERRQQDSSIAFDNRRSGDDRRDDERRSGIDRRDPFRNHD